MGAPELSKESPIGARMGALEVRDFRRKGSEDRIWNWGEFLEKNFKMDVIYGGPLAFNCQEQ